MSLRVWRWISLTACAALVAVAFGTLSNHQPPASKKLGRFTEKEIIARSEPLSQAIVPGGQLRFSTTTGDARTRRESNQRCWFVDACTADGHHVLSIVWNADTGTLQYVGVKGQRDAHVARVSSREAQWASQQWIRRLGLSHGEGTWRLQKAPYRLGTAWFALWTSGDRKVIVNIDANTGGLLAAYAYNSSVG